MNYPTIIDGRLCKKHQAYTTQCKTDPNVMIMIVRMDDGWDVYYAKHHYAYVVAFGLPLVHTIREVLEIADANVEQYKPHFMEE